MSVFRPSELRQFLDSLGVKARKSLSQNFLIDGNILRKIISTAHINADDLILEIGPGPGALTEFLLQTGADVVAIEKDRVFAEALKRLVPLLEDRKIPRLEIIEADALDFDISMLYARSPSIKVVANLPYQLTTPILAKLLPLAPHIKTVTVMVQKEVAERIVAPAGSVDYSSLSIFVQLYAKARFCFSVEPTCFYPRPKVRSAVVHFDLHVPPQGLDVEGFTRFVRTAFGKRRKTLRSSLTTLFPKDRLINALQKLGWNEDMRPEMLSLQQFITLYHCLESLSS